MLNDDVLQGEDKGWEMKNCILINGKNIARYLY